MKLIFLCLLPLATAVPLGAQVLVQPAPVRSSAPVGQRTTAPAPQQPAANQGSRVVQPGAISPREALPTGAAAPVAPAPVPKATSAFRALVDSLSAPPSYVRELFQYPIAGRPDPVTPPLSLLSSEAYPAIALSGIVYDERHPARSYAMVRFPSGGGAGPTAGKSREVVHVGDVIGQYVISTIERTRVGVDVRLFGGTRRVYLTQGAPSSISKPSQRPVRVR